MSLPAIFKCEPRLARLSVVANVRNSRAASPRPAKTSAHSAPARRASASRARASTASSRTSCARRATSPAATAPAASPSTARSSRTRTSSSGTPARASSPWCAPFSNHHFPAASGCRTLIQATRDPTRSPHPTRVIHLISTGQRGPRHQRLAVLHLHLQDGLARRQARRLRRRRRRAGRRPKNRIAREQIGQDVQRSARHGLRRDLG